MARTVVVVVVVALLLKSLGAHGLEEQDWRLHSAHLAVRRDSQEKEAGA